MHFNPTMVKNPTPANNNGTRIALVLHENAKQVRYFPGMLICQKDAFEPLVLVSSVLV